MINDWKKIIWQQLGAAVESLENAIKACPEKVWGDKPGFHEFWYIAYHTLFFLDYYMSGTDQSFAPPEPFTLSELDPSGLLPDRVYTKEELLKYRKHQTDHPWLAPLDGYQNYRSISMHRFGQHFPD